MTGVLVAGCGGEDGESADSGSGDGSQSLSITGNPPSSITQGASFSFTPTVNNPDSGSLTFSVSNLPSWASFDASNGRITGTPGPNDVGTYPDISITVSNGTSTASSPGHTVQVVGTASGAATLSWLPPTEYTDGSPLVDLSGYRVYWGTSPDGLANSAPLDNPSITTYVVEQLTPATWYFAVTALDASGMESSFSNVASKTIL